VSERRNHNDVGFTLIELLMVCTILPLIIGAISVALISVLSVQSNVSNRLNDSTDAQTVSANFQKDVQSAVKLTTSTVPLCGSGTQLLGLEWSINQQPNPAFQSIVSYVQVSNGPSSDSLVRQYCASGTSSTPTSTSFVSADVPTGQLPPTITPSTLNTSQGPVLASDVTKVTFSITEPRSNYSYTLLAVPAASSSTAQTSNVAPATTTCNFATPSTGTYASTLCFADFSSYSQAAIGAVATPAQPTPGCDTMTAALANFTLSFCVVVSGGPVAAVSLPTYPEAFLGCGPPPICNVSNVGNFYTGVAGSPALYQTAAANGSITTVTITNIQVYAANGAPATGWEFVSGDAESTDAGEYITWTSDQNLTLLGDSATNPIGNACGYSSPPASSPYPNAYLTGVGTTSVECMANGYETSGNKTGTVMLEAAAPTTLTVVMKGNGLQAIFLGLLLPG
jgi:type II secretory pathway component PulJ